MAAGDRSHLTRRHHRSTARRRQLDDRVGRRTETPIDPLLAVDDRLEAVDDADRCAEALDRLPAGERDALLMVAWDDLTPTEVAEALGVPAPTVRTRLRRARLGLRATIKDRQDGDESATEEQREDIR